MTQEELDVLMASDNLDEISQEEEPKKENEHHEYANMAGQLNSVTVDSEKKATEIMTMLDQVLAELDANEICIKEKDEDKSLIIINDIRNMIFEIMSVMQYQDIHRQKIERVMNTMIDISQMMTTTLGSIGIQKAPQAKHIDSDDGETIDDDELAKLIAQMGN
jgi:hypothetical protein